MIKTTRWRPDTCECVLEYSWDDSVSQNKREHINPVAVQTCEAHKALASHSAKYTAVSEESTNRQKALEIIKASLPDHVQERTQDDGTVVTEFKPGLSPTHAFGDNFVGNGRVLQMAVPAIDNAIKADLETEFDSNIGAGKVEVS